jgi:hypothetical protein
MKLEPKEILNKPLGLNGLHLLLAAFKNYQI